MTQDMGKAEVLNTVFASVLTSKISLQGPQASQRREQNWSEEDVLLETGPAQGILELIGRI